MKKLGSFFLIISLLALLVGCLGEQSGTKGKIIEQPKVLLNQVGFSAKPSIVTLNNQIFLLNAEKRGIVFYELGKELLLSEDNTNQQWLYTDGENLYAFWWSAKEKAKFLKVRVSKDQGKTFSDAVTLNNGTGVLPDISIASNGKGYIAIAYTDERELGYGVYLNSSIDGGLNWRKEDLRLDIPVITTAMKQAGNTKPSTFANSPKLAFVNDRLIAVWQQVDMTELGGYIFRIVSKSSTDLGGSWSAESNVFAAPNMQPVEMNVFHNKNNIYVFAMLTEGNNGFKGFYNVNSEANVWKEVNNTILGEGFSKRQISWIKGVVSGDNLVLAFTSEPTEGLGKVQADVLVLSTINQEWLGPVKQLDIDKGHNLTKSTYPNLISVGATNVFVVWEDYRTIVPSIYYDISKDNGKTWLPKPRPLTTPGLVVAKDPKLDLSEDTNKLWLSYFMVELNGQNPQGTRVFQEFTKDKNGNFDLPVIDIQQPSLDKLKERLVERANKFWALREERKWEETWDYMEPVYRERFDKTEWLAQQGKISFSKTAIDEPSIDIQGNLATITANIELSVNQQVGKQGLLESAPPNQQKVDMKWGWFYDDWYFMPDVIFGNHLEY